MASTTAAAERPTFSARLLVAGLVASLVMGMWEMIVEALLANGAGFWGPVVYVAATVLRGLQNVGKPVPFDLVAVVVGLMGHMMVSVVLGLIFAYLIAPRARSLAGQLIGGMVYGVVIYLVMWYVVLPAIDPVMLNLNAVVFLVAHLMWGAVLGVIHQRVTAGA